MHLTALDIGVFAAYFFGVIGFAMLVAARSRTKSASDYFLASKKLPWYAVGASFIASNISTEHFIGMVGWGFLYGMAVAQWEWGNVVTFSMLIWIFLPFYMRGNVATMPEFLERRFNPACRYIYALVMIVGLVIAMLGGVLFAGAKAMNVFFPGMSMSVAVILLAVGAGTYTVYGGLLSAVWADFVQYILLMVAGIVVVAFGLYHVGGLDVLARELPEKFLVFYPPTHEMIPFTGLIFGLFSVGVWYSCANQFMVQRCLGARSEWDARMGIVMAGFSKALLPLLVVVPGIIAFYMFQDRISDGDKSWPFLVSQWLPSGFVGLVLAGLASAILSTLSAITNSSSTIFTLDLYHRILRPEAPDRELHWVGRISATVIMLVGVVVALILTQFPGLTVFEVIQQVFFYIAGPIAAIFLVGILWKRATSVAATAALVVGFVVFLPLTKFVLFRYVPLLQPYDNFQHHTFVVFVLSAALLVLVSVFTRPKSDEELKGVVWTREALRSTGEGRRGTASLVIGWAAMVVVIVALYIITHLQGSNTLWLEAENVPYEAEGGTTEVQPRAVVAKTDPGFNLWTGSGQVLFSGGNPSGGRVEFRPAVEEAGRYAVAALVTKGPDYTPFRVEVNGTPAVIRYPVPQEGPDGRVDGVVYEEVSVFDAHRGPEHIEKERGTTAGQHAVRRIEMGTFDLRAGENSIAFIPAGEGSQPARIGVDQLMLTIQDARPESDGTGGS